MQKLFEEYCCTIVSDGKQDEYAYAKLNELKIMLKKAKPLKNVQPTDLGFVIFFLCNARQALLMKHYDEALHEIIKVYRHFMYERTKRACFPKGVLLNLILLLDIYL